MSMPARFGSALAMWFVMMIAMMLPSATPAILLYARIRRSRRSTAIAPAWLFMAGYLIAWLAFSLAAAAAQLALVHGGAIKAMELRTNVPLLTGAVLVVAGAYQMSQWKDACLGQCRSPAVFISRHWRPGAAGAIRLGLLHGAQCVGCCWLLMTLLFAGGVMNLAWVAALAALVAAEKLLPSGRMIGRAAGALMIASGTVVAIAG